MPARHRYQQAKSVGVPYYERLSPMIEYAYDRVNGKPLMEIVVFDDRDLSGHPDATGAVHVQFFPLFEDRNGKTRRAKGTVLRFNGDAVDSLHKLSKELGEDLADLASLL